jgi:hypothetical protein
MHHGSALSVGKGETRGTECGKKEKAGGEGGEPLFHKLLDAGVLAKLTLLR